VKLWDGHDGTWCWSFGIDAGVSTREIKLAYARERSPVSYREAPEPFLDSWRFELDHLRALDGVIFVAESQPAMRERNVYFLERLRNNLVYVGREPNRIPLVFQLNNRDAEDALPIDVLRSDLEWPLSVYQPSIAVARRGLKQALDQVLEMIDTRS
jgi:hypothetical protein